jgi:glycosyltransferase involved in cell wall biosynthesis
MTSDQPLRVGLVLSGSESYGVATFVESLAKALNRDKIRLCGVFLEPIDDDNVLARLMDEVFRLDAGFIRGIHALGDGVAGKRTQIAWLVKAASRLARCAHKARFDVLDVHDYHISLAAGMAARLSGIPCVRHCHMIHQQRSGVRRLVARAAAFLTDRLVCASQYVQGTLTPAMQKKSVVAHIGVDIESLVKRQKPGALRRMLGIPPTAPVIMLSARLTPLKGQDVLLQAAPHVLAKIPDARFVLTGCEVDVHDTPFLDHLKATTAQLSIGDRVVFTGDLPNAAEYYCDCDVLCSLTKPCDRYPAGEACSVSILEALACGIPVVGTAYGSTPELISHGVNGLLVPPGEPQPLAEALIALLQDAPRRRLMGEQGRRIAGERFDIRQVAQNTEQLWLDLCRRNPAAEKTERTQS